MPSLASNLRTASLSDDADTLRVFDSALGRTETTARTLAGIVGSFAVFEGASQTGATSKRWESDHDEHAHMDGETVRIDKPFSNGGMWPRDLAGATEAAACSCSLTFEYEEQS